MVCVGVGHAVHISGVAVGPQLLAGMFALLHNKHASGLTAAPWRGFEQQL